MRFGKIAMLGAVMVSGMTVLAGCGSQQTNLTSKFMTVDPTTQTVKINLVAGYNEANDNQNFDGYANGQMTISVPEGYNVELDVSDNGGIPADVGVYTSSKKLAFPGAGDSIGTLFSNAVAGLSPGQSETLKFVPDATGTYQLANYDNRFMQLGDNAYQNMGMWAVFKVTNGGSPSITAK